MPKLRDDQVPSYRLHKQSGHAVVTLNGRDHLLGKHGSAASKKKYRQLTSEWLSNKDLPPRDTGADLTISELVLAFWKHAKKYYRKPDGSRTSEVGVYRPLLRLLREMYGKTPAAEFGPRRFKTLLQEMVTRGRCRKSINKHRFRIINTFAWAVGEELIPDFTTGMDGKPASLLGRLRAVKALSKGRTDAQESSPVRPVPEALVEAVFPHVSRQVKSMIELQLLTGARPGEMCIMRGCDIDTSGKIWLYRPESHKNQHRDEDGQHERIVYIGPRARELVEQHLKTNPQAYLFSPADAEAERLVKRHEQRKTPLKYGNAPGTTRTRRPQRAPKDRYTVASYRRAIERACEIVFKMPKDFLEPRGKKATDAEKKLPADVQAKRRKHRQASRAAWRGEHCWHPHQLRHTSATRLRKEYGLEAAQVILGHKTLAVTEIYAEKNVEAARRIMAEVG